MSYPRAERRAVPRRGRRAVLVAVLVAGLAVALAWLGTAWALASADGVTRVLGVPDQSQYDTEFIEDWIYMTTAALTVVLVGLAARL